jgi:hypothetical protein
MQALKSETPGGGTPGDVALSKNLPLQNSSAAVDVQLLTRDAGWEFCSILAGCAVAAMAAFSGGSALEIRENLRCARLALLEARDALYDLEKVEGRLQ